MPFEIPENIHPDCARLAWILGRWAGQRARGVPHDREVPVRPGGDLPAGRSAVHPLPEPRVDRRRAGQRRCARPPRRPGSCGRSPTARLEVVLAHNTGFVEVWYGEIHPEQPRFEIATDAVVRTATAKEYVGGKRLYGYVNGDLMYAYDMAAVGQELQPHTHAQLVRAVGGDIDVADSGDLAGDAPRGRLPADPAAGAGAHRGRDPRPRHARRGLRRGTTALVGDQPLHRSTARSSCSTSSG